MAYKSLTSMPERGIMMVIIETQVFTSLVKKLLTDDEYRCLQEHLAVMPEAGKVIKGSGGLRKVRWKSKGTGKRGGTRVIYFWKTNKGQILLLYIYTKKLMNDLTKKQIKQLKEIVEGSYYE